MNSQVRRTILKGLALGTPAAFADLTTATARPAPSLRDNLRRVLGTMPAHPQPAFTVLEASKIAGGVRYKIEYLAEAADPVLHTPIDLIRAYLLVPDHAPGARLPAVVAIHQDGPQSHIGKSEVAGLAGDPTLAYGLELFERGYVVICPDRFEHAERRRVMPNDMTSVDPDRDDMLVNHWVGQLVLRGRTAYGKEAYDLSVTTDVLASLDYVDSKRIGAIGHSAGGNALVYFMFNDPRIACGVSSCGLFSETAFYDEKAPKRRMAAFALPGLLAAGVTADYLGLIAPRPMLLTRGLSEWGRDNAADSAFSDAHVQDTRDMEAHARRAYLRMAAPSELNVVYFDEDGGNHAFPPGVKHQAFQWLDTQLKGPA